jgi:hypothetical protein
MGAMSGRAPSRLPPYRRRRIRTCGWLGSANQMNLPPDFDYRHHKTGFEWTDVARYTRLSEALAGEKRWSVEETLKLQTDVLSVPARRLCALLAGRTEGGRRRGPRLPGRLGSPAGGGERTGGALRDLVHQPPHARHPQGARAGGPGEDGRRGGHAALPRTAGGGGGSLASAPSPSPRGMRCS